MQLINQNIQTGVETLQEVKISFVFKYARKKWKDLLIVEVMLLSGVLRLSVYKSLT